MADCSIGLQAKDWIVPAIAAVGTLLASIAGHYFANKFTIDREIASESRTRQIESRRLAQAFLGEIVALEKIAETRLYIESLGRVIEHMETTNTALYFGVKVTKDYFNVYKANVSQIGILETPLPEMICTFYTQMNSILEDFESLSKQEVEVDFVLTLTKELHKLTTETMDLGRQIKGKIKELYQ